MKGIVVETVREDVGPMETLFAMPKDPRAIHVSGDQQILHTPEIRVRVTVEFFGREADNIRPGDTVRLVPTDGAGETPTGKGVGR